MKYVLDKNAHILLEKIITSSIIERNEMDRLALESLIYEEIPKGIYDELTDSWFSSYSANGKNIILTKPFPVFEIGDSSNFPFPKFNYIIDNSRKCLDLVIQDVGKVHKPDLEAVASCIKNSCVLVTDDKPLIHLSECLGQRVIKFDDFANEIGLKNILNKKIILLINSLIQKKHEPTKPATTNPNKSYG